MIEHLQAEVGHAHLVDVGKSEGERYVYGSMIFPDRVDLIPDIPAGTLNLPKPIPVEHGYAPDSLIRSPAMKTFGPREEIKGEDFNPRHTVKQVYCPEVRREILSFTEPH
jgi:hypothetical protein